MEAIDLFLEHGVDLNRNESSSWPFDDGGQYVAVKDKWTPLMHACSKDDIGMVKRLLAHGADVNVICQSPPDHAYQITTAMLVSLGHKEVLQVLLDHGADVNLTDARGNTPLLSRLIARERETTTRISIPPRSSLRPLQS